MIESLFERIDALLRSQSQVRIAIDGDAAAGKSTLAAELKQHYACNILAMDHFFLRLEQRTTERLCQPGGNVDYERFKVEALTPLIAGIPFTYRPFDCRIGDFGDEIAILPRPLNVVEGAYSLHPTLAYAYHIKVFLTVDPAEQLCRIAERNGAAMLERFQTEWIPMEKQYFAHFGIEKTCDFVFS